MTYIFYETYMYFCPYFNRKFPEYLRHSFFFNIGPRYGLLLTEVSGQHNGPIFEK
jgi:hypothetical protein